MQTPADILDENGALAGLVPDFTVRPQQVALAEAIRAAIDSRESLICEAGTGTGKTFAYLVPALQSGHKVIISTGTKHLQDQLFSRDLPLVRKAVGRALKVALLKGRANYLCRHRLQLAETDTRRLDLQARGDLADIRAWSQRTDSGDLAELTHIPEDAPVRTACVSTTDNCLNQDCDFYDDCFVFRARRRAAEADLAVVNHHLFLADVVLKEAGYGELLPSADVVIFDEAHQLPELASQFFSETLSSRQLLELVSDSRAAYFEEAADLPDFPALLDGFDKALRDLRLSLPREDSRVAWVEVKETEQVSAALAAALEKMADVRKVLAGFANRGKALDNCHKRVAAALALLERFADGNGLSSGKAVPSPCPSPSRGEGTSLRDSVPAGGEAVSTGGARDGYIRWLEVRGRHFYLHQTPLDVADVFRTRMDELEGVNVFTSATLSVAQRFDYFSARLGLEQVPARGWDSPFDFEAQSLLYLPRELPDPRSQDFTARLVETAIPLLRLTGGRAFLLFTSHRALRQAAALVGEALDYPILVQGEAPRTELLETFRTTPHAVLLGTSSFWEGVDVRGQALSCVVIDKLPFAAPGDPVLKARLTRMAEQGRNPFLEYQVPEAVLTLKQGIGRLIRDRNDYGILMIGDPRLTGKPYGRTFLNSLPQMGRTRELAEVEAFLRGHEDR